MGMAHLDCHARTGVRPYVSFDYWQTRTQVIFASTVSVDVLPLASVTTSVMLCVPFASSGLNELASPVCPPGKALQLYVIGGMLPFTVHEKRPSSSADIDESIVRKPS